MIILKSDHKQVMKLLKRFKKGWFNPNISDGGNHQSLFANWNDTFVEFNFKKYKNTYAVSVNYKVHYPYPKKFKDNTDYTELEVLAYEKTFRTRIPKKWIDNFFFSIFKEFGGKI